MIITSASTRPAGEPRRRSRMAALGAALAGAALAGAVLAGAATPAVAIARSPQRVAAAPGVVTRTEVSASSITAGHELLCVYRYVVTDGVANNVTIYRNPTGKARAGSLKPGDSFLVYFGSSNGGSDHVAGRQRMYTFGGIHGWVTYPRSYLKDLHKPCFNV